MKQNENRIIYFLSYLNSPPEGLGLLCEVPRSRSDTPQSVGLLWTSDQSVAETSTWEHTTLTTDIHASGGIWTLNSSKGAAIDPRIWPCGH